jgi:putative copper export protein
VALGDVGRGARRRARSLAVAAAATAAYAGLLTPLLRTRRPGNPVDVWLSETWGTVTGTPWGRVWLAREAAVLLAVAAVWAWTRSGDRSSAGPRRRVALAALGLVALLEAMAGHAVDLPDDSGVAVLASATHLLAAGVWAGGLVVLVVCVVPLVRREPGLRGPVLSTVWRGFSPMAAVASVVLLATGLYEAGVHVPGAGFLRSTVYGGAVSAKTVLVVVALALAGLNTLRVHPRLAAAVGSRLGRPPGWAPLSQRRFSSVVAAEAVVLGFGVAAAALVTSVPTAREVAAATRVTAPHHEDVNGLYVTFEDLPAGPDRATLLVRVRPTVLPEPAPVTGVRVALQGPGSPGDTVVLTAVEPGRYEAPVPAPEPGSWDATVTVVRPGLADTVTRARWVVDDPTTAGPTAWRRTTSTLAAVLLAGLGALLARALLVRRRSYAAVPVPARLVREPGRSPR